MLGESSVRGVAILTAFNEGDEVARTARSALASVGPDGHVVVVDDASGDGSCEGAWWREEEARVTVVRNDTQQGVGRSRNRGVLAAEALGYDVLSFHDAHMRFPDDVLQQLHLKAAEGTWVVTGKSRGWWTKAGKDHPFAAWGADMHWNLRDGLQPKYILYANKREGGQLDWARVPCPMGACYCFSRETVATLSAPTGTLWDDTAGLWGFSEQALAVKAFLLDVPILVSKDLATHHHYRSQNPVPQADMHLWRNLTHSMAKLLSPGTFDFRFRPFCACRFAKDELERIIAEARETPPEFSPRQVEREPQIWTHLLGRNAPMDTHHPDHDWLYSLNNALGALKLAPGADDPGAVRVLQWRPGESTILVLDQFPNARIDAFEWVSHRYQNWQAMHSVLPQMRLTKIDGLGDWPTLRDRIPEEAKYDLVILGGEMPSLCLETAKKHLAPGAEIVINPSADTYGIEDAERYNADEKLKAHAKEGRHPAVSMKGQPSVTVCLLNWQRAANIGKILECLQAQTIKPRVVVWDNGAEDHGSLSFMQNGAAVDISRHPLVSLVVRPSENMGCFPRWWLAAASDTDYVCSMDDDLVFKGDSFLEDAIAAHREECSQGIVGLVGWSAYGGRSYKAARHHNGTTKGTDCDVIKGRFMLLHTSLLERVPMRIPDVTLWEDDIYLSLALSRGEVGFHRIPQRLGKRWRELPNKGPSSAGSPGHYQVRDKMVKKLLEYWRDK